MKWQKCATFRKRRGNIGAIQGNKGHGSAVQGNKYSPLPVVIAEVCHFF